jgi:GNAT superfamily N-acetyltransferase
MRHLISQPHIIFSVENSPYPDKVQVPFAHEEAIQFLKQNVSGGKVYSLDGYYGKPEKSILITDPSDEQKEAARTLAHMTGQESHIESDGYTHKMIYNHGPNSGKVVMGQGTEFHQAKPKDMYSVLPDGSTFTHNFNFAEPFKKARIDEGKSPEEKRSARAERQSSWEKENYGMASGASKNREIAGFMHRAKLRQIRNSPIPKLPKSEKSKPKFEPLMKPYVSEAQRRWAHTPAGIKALGGKKAVEHWDKESKGKDLPEKIEKALSPEELKAQGYKFRYYGRNPIYHVIQVFKDRKKVGHLAYTKNPVSNSFSKDFGYHRVELGRIEPEHQGKGLYQNMLNMAKDHVKSLGSKGIMSEGYQRSKAATRAWDKVATHADPHTSNASVRGRLSPEDSDYYLAASEMEKGLKGDWKKEGYTLKFHPPKVEMFNGKHDITSHRVTAHDPKGNRVGDYYFSEWPEASEHKGLLHVTFSSTDPDHQRKGLASAAYSVIEQKTGKKLHSSVGNRSADAKKLWAQPNRQFGKSLQKASLSSAPKVNINPEHGKKIADAYHNMKHDPNLDPKHHEKLANDEDQSVRSAIAENPSYIKYKQNEERGIDKNMQDIQSMDRLVKSRLERRSGLYLGKSWQAASAKDNREGRSLDKAIDPNSFKRIKNSHDKVKFPIVDNNAHGANHPMADEHFLDHIVKSPQIFKDQSKSYTKGISSKNIFDIKSYKDEEGQNVTLAKPKTFMIKPYYGHLESSTKTYTKNPIKGWATLTTKNLLHAADMGHMAEDVSYYEHQGVPVTVHKFNHDYVDLPSGEGKAHPLDVQKIAIMDYLTNNVDRHAGNIMLSKDKFPVHRDDKSNSQKEGFSRPLLIDHERNFQYNRGIRNKFGKNDPTKNKDAISDYLWNSSLGSIASKFEPYEMHEHADDLADWWNNNSKKIEETFDKNLAHIKDEGLKNHIASNFKQRMKSVHDVFNNENYYEMFSPKSRLGEVNVGKTKHTTSKVPKKLAASEEGLK